MLKETILSKSLTSHALDEDELKQLVDNSLTNETDSANLGTATAEKVGQSYMIKGVQYVCEDKGSGVYEWETYDTSGQNLNYADASNKPTLNGIPLNGSLSPADLELAKDAASRTITSVATAKEFLIGNSELITYENLAAALNTLFGIANLPKYETYNNPLLTSAGGKVSWTITHTCKTNKPMIQVHDKNGEVQDSNNLIGFVIINRLNGTVSVEFDSVSNVAANEYYVVLIG